MHIEYMPKWKYTFFKHYLEFKHVWVPKNAPELKEPIEQIDAIIRKVLEDANAR